LSLVNFGQNFIQYNRSGRENPFGSGIRFEEVKNEAYIFIDGWDK